MRARRVPLVAPMAQRGIRRVVILGEASSLTKPNEKGGEVHGAPLSFGPDLAPDSGMSNIVFRGGPRDASTEAIDGPMPAVIGDGAEGGVYQRTDGEEDGQRIYAWQPLTDAATNALVRGDLRANQQ